MINGDIVGDTSIAPTCSNYERRFSVAHDLIDLTSVANKQINAIALTVVLIWLDTTLFSRP